MENSKLIREWIRPGIYNGLQKISIPLFGVLTTALLAHKALTKPEMGVWVNFLALTTFVEMFRAGLVRFSLIRYINFSEQEQHTTIMSSAFFLNVLASLLIAVGLFVSAGYIEHFLRSPGLAFVLHIYAVTLLILIFFSHLEWLMYAHLDFKSLFATYVVRQGSTFFAILIYYLIAGKATLEALVYIYSGGILLGTIAGFRYMRHLFQRKFIYSGFWIRKLWRYGRYVFGSNMSTLIFRNADQFLLSNITANPAIVASQNISMRAMNIADIPSQITGDILFPKNSRPELKENKHLTKYYYEKAVGASLSVILPIMVVLLLFPRLLILVLAGPEYLDAVPYLRLISLTIFTQAFLKQFGVVMDSSGYPHINFRVVTSIAIAMVIFCYLFIPSFHLMGAAYALLCAHVFGFTLSMIVLHRYYKISIFNTLKYCFSFYPQILKLLADRFRKKETLQYDPVEDEA